MYPEGMFVRPESIRRKLQSINPKKPYLFPEDILKLSSNKPFFPDPISMKKDLEILQKVREGKMDIKREELQDIVAVLELTMGHEKLHELRRIFNPQSECSTADGQPEAPRRKAVARRSAKKAEPKTKKASLDSCADFRSDKDVDNLIRLFAQLQVSNKRRMDSVEDDDHQSKIVGPLSSTGGVDGLEGEPEHQGLPPHLVRPRVG